ncbi:hypothetical protein PG993_011919 [Apiospora rasikravindrae]|uniref:Uncharacterized protein n=1 Tax=Apiospora rasikravindrae TaxID=990691 RepID=A0ABR1S139_9PEZI
MLLVCILDLPPEKCRKDPYLRYPGYNVDVDGYVSTRGRRIPLELSEKHKSPIMIEVKAAGWKDQVWKQLTAEMAAWIYQTEEYDKSATSQAQAGDMRHNVLMTQHGAEIYLILGSYGPDHIRYIHSNHKYRVVLPPNLSADIDLYEDKKEDLENHSDAVTAHENTLSDMQTFFSVLTAVLHSKNREHEQAAAAESSKGTKTA